MSFLDNVAPFFDGFVNELMGISIWRMSAFLITQDENLDFVLFFTRFLSRGQLSKRCFFQPFSAVFASPLS